MVQKKKTRKGSEVEIKKLKATIRRLRKQIKEMKDRDDARYGLDGRLKPHYDGEFA
jgi:hypothetical protein